MPDVNLGNSGNNYLDLGMNYQNADGTQGEVKFIGNQEKSYLIITQDPTKSDTITKAMIVEMQYGRITGVYGSSPSNPVLDPPTEDPGHEEYRSTYADSVYVPPGGGNNNQVQALKANPWFNISFLAVFSSIMNEILELEKGIHFKEAQSEMKARNNMIEISKTQSELTKALYETRAEEKMVEAITSFVQAGVAAISVGITVSNTAQARAEVTKMVDDQKAKVATLEQSQGTTASTNPTQAKPNDTPELKQARDDLRAMQSEHWKESTIQQKITQFNQLTTFKMEVVKNCVNGISQMMQAGLIAQEGAIDALKTMNDGYLQVLSKYADNSAKSRDDAKANYDKFLDFFQKIVDSDFKAHYIGQGV